MNATKTMNADDATNFDYPTLFGKLNELGIDYLVVGGLAVNFHGIPRMTYDIDLLVSVDPQNILKAVSQLTAWGYRPKIAVDPRGLADEATRAFWMKEKGMKALNLYSDGAAIGEIDLVFDSPIPFEQLKSRALTFELQGEKIPVISILDLIQLKLDAGRKQDLTDIEHLRMILKRS